MPTARPNSASVPSGGDLEAGRTIAGPSGLGALVAGMSAGDWLQVPEVTGLLTGLFVGGGGGGSNIIDWTNKCNWDPVAQQVRWISQAHNDEQAYYSWDADSRVFSKLADPPWDTGGTGYPGYIGHGYHHNAMDPATGDDYYRMVGAVVRRRDASDGTWSTIANAAYNGFTIANAIEWLPSIGTEGGLVTVNATTVQRWDKQTNAWSTVTSSLPTVGNHCFALRSVPNNLVLFGGGNDGGGALYSVGPTGSVTTRATCPINISSVGNIPVCDPATGDLLVFGGTAGNYRYDVTLDSWDSMTLTGAPSFGTPGASSRILVTALPDHGAVLFVFGAVPAIYLHKAP